MPTSPLLHAPTLTTMRSEPVLFEKHPEITSAAASRGVIAMPPKSTAAPTSIRPVRTRPIICRLLGEPEAVMLMRRVALTQRVRLRRESRGQRDEMTFDELEEQTSGTQLTAVRR